MQPSLTFVSRNGTKHIFSFLQTLLKSVQKWEKCNFSYLQALLQALLKSVEKWEKRNFYYLQALLKSAHFTSGRIVLQLFCDCFVIEALRERSLKFSFQNQQQCKLRYRYEYKSIFKQKYKTRHVETGVRWVHCQQPFFVRENGADRRQK